MAKITWNTDVNAPCCPGEIIGPRERVLAPSPKTGRQIWQWQRPTILVQTDWDYPGVASTFGWDIRGAQREVREEALEEARAWLQEAEEVAARIPDALSPEYASAYADVTDARQVLTVAHANLACDHSHTDGTVTCPDCGLTATDFIAAAGDWLACNDGATAEDPGYF